MRHEAKRRRIKTVMQEPIYRAGRLIEHGRRMVLGLGANDRNAAVFMRLHAQFAATESLRQWAVTARRHAYSPRLGKLHPRRHRHGRTVLGSRGLAAHVEPVAGNRAAMARWRCNLMRIGTQAAGRGHAIGIQCGPVGLEVPDSRQIKRCPNCQPNQTAQNGHIGMGQASTSGPA